MAHGRAVCNLCFNILHWISTKDGPVFWCPGCRRDVTPEEAVIHRHL